MRAMCDISYGSTNYWTGYGGAHEVQTCARITFPIGAYKQMGKIDIATVASASRVRSSSSTSILTTWAGNYAVSTGPVTP
jgi:hypothetical protein